MAGLPECRHDEIVVKPLTHDGANRPPFVRLFSAFATLKFPNNRFHSGAVIRLRPL
jgi:hypothetical protein